MPNWCENDMVISGPKDKVKALQMAVFTKGKDSPHDDNHFDFDKILPYPEKYKNDDQIRTDWRAANSNSDGSLKDGITFSMMPHDGYNAGGYNWCCENWGTKWPAGDFQNVNFELGAKSAKFKISFSTPWGPAIPVMLETSKQHPDITLTLKYYECGMAFKGTAKYKGGEEISHTRSDYHGHRGG